MANPNIVSVASIYGKTVYDTDIAASAASLVSNAASSGKIYKINSLIIANIDGTDTADITVTLRNAAGGTTHSTIANTVAVPADATLIVVSKDTSIYLEEDMSLYVLASAAGDLSATCSYEEISE
jgi:hypothetical protein